MSPVAYPQLSLPRTWPPTRRYPYEPVHTPMGARLRERTVPMAPDDDVYGYAHAQLCEAISRWGLDVMEVFDPPGDVAPFAPLLDPELCPSWALPWLAQLVGVVLPPGIQPNIMRELIVGLGPQHRGTPEAMRAALAPYLTGTKTVYFRERDEGDAYRLEVITLESEDAQPEHAYAALMTQKPAGIILSFRQVTGWDWQQVVDEYTTWADATAAFATWQDFRDKEPI